ncbi:uncharacterized protein si:dkey-92i15.4 isoform X1 [Takifugu flavidus]|uniref:Pro-interleukin-16 Interleukin-16 n=2 Tax=Takifugu flavidus TaxID=433684 RepID=A0A5C6PKD2_9TELE|nr:uncharacterized protein si:dkey-92i15.4 isoform X1 [Takifugu flavidus]XP_056901702.1 uncharacterized protein si:dkey-92i15.4 isoform X1 [Takifugu flavidus]XP_056901703.1 uncharacterized protein si:dkey-92i15.4 isoform X1 [Takifugu flavidus]TWW79198.1 Pro-interleukin-16 Interleukin-16 [Takifugu flavidus]
MDLSLLPTQVSEHKRPSARALFTVRSANSPSYNLSRRGGIRKTRSFLEEGSEKTEGGNKRHVTNKEENHTLAGSQSGWQGSVKGQREANNTSHYIMSTLLTQNGSADKTKTELDSVNRVNSHPSAERRGRTEWRRHDLPSRSQSLDFRTGKRSPDQDKSHNLFVLPSFRGGSIGKYGLGERKTEWDCERGRVRSSVQLFNSEGTTNDDKDMSPLSHHDQNLNRGDRGNSLPSRWRSLSGPGSDIRRTATTPGPKGSQSILERIKKLYGSTGFSKTEDYSRIRDLSKPGLSPHKETATDFNVSPQQRSHECTTGGTYPKHFSSGSTNSPGTSTSFNWTQNDTRETSLSPGTARNSEKLLRGQWHGKTEDRCSEDRGLIRSGAVESLGTMSLDRMRSRNSVAAQLRFARAAGEILPNTSSQEEEAPSWRDSLRLSEKRGAGGQIQVENVETDELNRTPKGREGGFKEGEEEKKPDNGATVDEDVFELHPQKAATKASEQKKVPEIMSVSSADSVKNRIHQFEALTQRFQDVAPGQLLPKRTFSVPTQVSRAQGGVKKSWSAKAIGELKERSEGLKEAGEAKGMFSRGKVGPGRSLSVDEVGLRLEEREGSELDHSGNNSAEDFQNYLRLKKPFEIPLKRDDQGPHGGFSIDETDFTKISSPDGERKRPTYLPLSVCSNTGGQQTSPSPTEDKTPSNTPTNSPHLSPTTQPEETTLSHRKTEAPPTDAAKSHKEEPPLLHATPPTYPHSRNTHLAAPDVSACLPRRGKQSVLDMDAWLSSLNTEINVWNDRDDSEDDDDDDEGTQKDEDSNYDSDSGESSVTITSNMSQSEQKSFSVSLSDLCNFAGVDYESENDDNDWPVNTRRSASLSSDISAFSCVSVLPSEELDKLLDDVRSLGDSNLQDYNAVQVVVLHKEVGMGLGFSVAGGVDQNKPVTVHKVLSSGVAAQEGSIQEGDTVLSINGTSLCGCAHWEALRVLRRARIRNLGVVVLRRGEDTNVSKIGGETSSDGPMQTQVTETGQRVCVRLEKKGRDLGFSLEGGAGFSADSSLENRPIKVQKIFQGGPVGQVCPGDEVLEIGGVSTMGMRRIEAWNLIRKLPAGPADLVLRRSQQET